MSSVRSWSSSVEWTVPGPIPMIPASKIENTIISTSSKEPLKLYTVCTPPEHPAGTTLKTKAQARACEHEHHK